MDGTLDGIDDSNNNNEADLSEEDEVDAELDLESQDNKDVVILQYY